MPSDDFLDVLIEEEDEKYVTASITQRNYIVSNGRQVFTIAVISSMAAT